MYRGGLQLECARLLYLGQRITIGICRVYRKVSRLSKVWVRESCGMNNVVEERTDESNSLWFLA